MRKIVQASLAAALLCFAPAARAQLSFDVKAAYAVPVGNVWTGSPWNPVQTMNAQWTGAVPLEIAARYHVTPAVSLGAYFDWGPAFTNAPGFNGMAGNAGSEMRVGLEVMAELGPRERWNPWFSLGTGWEWTRYATPAASVTLSGWEFVNVQGGVDWKPADAFGIGPYVGFFAGSYATGTSTDGYLGSIPSYARSFHCWFQLGLKGSVNL